MNINKIVTVLLWIASAGAWFVAADSSVVNILRGVFVFLVIAHIIEIAVFWKVLKNAPGSLGGHVFNTFLFGVFHVGPLKKAQAAVLTPE